MSDLHDRNELSGARLEDVRRLEIIYSRTRPGEGACFVEYIGGRVEVLEVDRYLIGRLLEHLEDRNPDS
ncbi:MAG TPA: hypothetical protein VJ827_13335 [Rubrobacter sp.]|nr:hypothetical protein [Rubrobacter sp.]